MFKRSLASLAAVAVASGVIVAPANAVTVEVNNSTMTCTIRLTNKESKLIGLERTLKPTQAQAAHLKENYGERRTTAVCP